MCVKCNNLQREFLLEHCSSHPLRIARHNPPLAIADNMKEDAKILGLVEDSHTFLGQTETTGETGLLLGILPHVDIRFKRMLVLAVRMGVALQAAAIVADDMTNGRVSSIALIRLYKYKNIYVQIYFLFLQLLQQANSTNPTAADGRIGYGYPFVDIFKEAVPLLPLGNHGIPNIGKYPSMILAMSDALGWLVIHKHMGCGIAQNTISVSPNQPDSRRIRRNSNRDSSPPLRTRRTQH